MTEPPEVVGDESHYDMAIESILAAAAMLATFILALWIRASSSTSLCIGTH